jgi:hypothetical protein
MKAVLGLTVLVCVGLMVYWFTAVPKGGGPSLAIPIAWGNAKGDQVEMHAIVGVALAHRSRRGEKGSALKTPNWDEWVGTHCLLADAAGQRVKLERHNDSAIVGPQEIQETVSTEEFFLTARLKAGTSYTFDYTIEDPDPETYRCQFTAPAQAEKAQVHSFGLVKK